MHDSGAFIVPIDERESRSLCRHTAKVLGILTRPSYHSGMDEKRKRAGERLTLIMVAMIIVKVFNYFAKTPSHFADPALMVAFGTSVAALACAEFLILRR